MSHSHHHHEAHESPDSKTEHLKHEMHEDHMHGHGGESSARDFLKRFFIVTALLIPLLGLSMVGMAVLGYEDFPARNYLEFVNATAIFAFGLVFFQHAYHELKSGKMGMMTLVSIAVGAGYIYSVLSTFIPALGTEFYLEISSLIWILLFGHYLEAKSSHAAGDALKEVAKLLPKEAHVIHGDSVHDMSVAKLSEGDRVLVKPGEKVPADGEIVKGEARFDESLLSGESKPVTKGVGDRVVAGAISTDSAVEIKLNRIGKNSTIGQIQALMSAAQKSKPSAQKLADRAASWLTVSALVVSILSVLVWTVAGQPFVFAFTLAITVLVIACPHALGLAIPTVTTIATRLAVKNGIFVKDMGKLEVVKNADYVVFDKTGTLTEGSFGVSRITAYALTEDDVVTIAASLEQSSTHVIGLSIVKYTKEKNLPLNKVENFKNHAGQGISGEINSTRYMVGNAGFMKALGHKIPDISGNTLIYVASKDALLGVIDLSDQIKKSAIHAVNALHALGVNVAMLTGDNQTVANQVAHSLNIDTVFAEVLPQDKFTHIKSLQAKGHTVIMVGDGINDAPALTQAHVGVAIGAGTDVAVEAGDVVLTDSDPQDIVSLIILSRKVYAKMQQNLWWALGYNIVAIPAAAGLFIPVGFQLSPQIGALAMALSSVIVVVNASSLRSTKLSVN